jgi:hypothetical protein
LELGRVGGDYVLIVLALPKVERVVRRYCFVRHVQRNKEISLKIFESDESEEYGDEVSCVVDLLVRNNPLGAHK